MASIVSDNIDILKHGRFVGMVSGGDPYVIDAFIKCVYRFNAELE